MHGSKAAMTGSAPEADGYPELRALAKATVRNAQLRADLAVTER
jgi:hypothetical protein